jgi:hypothetical protein
LKRPVKPDPGYFCREKHTIRNRGILVRAAELRVAGSGGGEKRGCGKKAQHATYNMQGGSFSPPRPMPTRIVVASHIWALWRAMNCFVARTRNFSFSRPLFTAFLPPLTNMPGQYRYHEVALLSDPLYALPVLA